MGGTWFLPRAFFVFYGHLRCYSSPFELFWQSVSSRRGPIYRARIYENTHEMGDGNACVVK